MGWRHHEIVVAASGATGRMRFESLTPTFCRLTLDDISVTPVDGATPTLRELVPPASLRPSKPAANTAASGTSTLAATATATVTADDSVATNATLQIQLCPVLTIFGSVGHKYRIESTDELESASWQVVTHLTLSSNPQIWVDTHGANALRRFYRAVPTGR
jgi:hypothetical protein